MSLNDQQFTRYSRHLLMDDIGEAGQEKLLNAHVLIVGMGGLGCPVSLYLAAAGIGQLSICDGDTVDQSNLQRQVLYTSDDCGKPKVECARQRLNKLNPEVQISVYAEEVAEEILAVDYSLVVDCTDNLAARQQLNAHCYQRKIPLVSASALGWEGQLMAFDFGHNASLCLNCIIDQDSAEPMMNCGNAGVVGPVLGAMGSLQATTVIRVLLGYFQQHGQVQRYDGKAGQWMVLRARADEGCAVCGSKSTQTKHQNQE
ncbi:MAG: HesA/MoeB/ThiF family protein [Porticoccaceae bacterium]|nr:HesA/MoeB/ThiF family protein [Porticoccaceae bacterium]